MNTATQALLAPAVLEKFQLHIDQPAADTMPAYWAGTEQLVDLMKYFRHQSSPRFEMLFDLSAVDESRRNHNGFTVFYILLSVSGKQWLRIKVSLPVAGELPSLCAVWPNANWYERELYDMFGIRVRDHPNLTRILMPGYWRGHPLLKEHPGRATDMEPFSMPDEKAHDILHQYQYKDTMTSGSRDGEVVINMGPTHPGTHGLLRLVVRLNGEYIEDVQPDIGFHHRGAEKIAERQTYHTYLPYTDRIDYVAGVQNELPYVLAVEQLARIEVPMRAQYIRVMLCELFRISSHLVWLASFGHDLGSMAPPFYAFRDRERLFDVVEMITGGRMHPAFFRIGGVALDLPDGWRQATRELLHWLGDKLGECELLLTKNSIFQARTRGVGKISQQDALAWGISGPNLRACGLPWDLRKISPYSAYDQFEFEVPVADEGDSLARSLVRFEEIRQSMRIIEQACAGMPGGPVISDRAPFAMADKRHTLEDIETLIHHFIYVGRGVGQPEGESFFVTEAPKGMNAYLVFADGGPSPYRLRIRTPSFAHMQSVPVLAKNHMLADLVTILGSIDYVLADIDR